MTHPGNHIVVCKEHGNTLRQCRCPGTKPRFEEACPGVEKCNGAKLAAAVDDIVPAAEGQLPERVVLVGSAAWGKSTMMFGDRVFVLAAILNAIPEDWITAREYTDFPMGEWATATGRVTFVEGSRYEIVVRKLDASE